MLRYLLYGECGQSLDSASDIVSSAPVLAGLPALQTGQAQHPSLQHLRRVGQQPAHLHSEAVVYKL